MVMPTFFGPTNVPPLEAMTYGCPVITSDIYGIPDQLGDAALYVDPNSVEDIADKMLMLWNNNGKREKLIAKGYEQLEKRDFKTFSQRLLLIVEEYLKKRRK